MYLDTLKISSMEQSVSSTSARGGKNNSELIFWNFGKEITVNLTDAICTPASLSLLWGGKFGTKNAEINGFWNPIYYKQKEDLNKSIYTYTSQYLGYSKEDIMYPYILNINEEPVDYTCKLFLPRVQKIGQPAERAKIILKNFSDFKTYIRKKGVHFKDRVLLHEIGVNGIINFDNKRDDTFYEYEWKDCEIQMISLEGRQDIYYGMHIDILYRINTATLERKILIKRTGEEDYYNSQIDFFILKDNEKIKVGTFYINDSFNSGLSLENSIYQLNSGINGIYYLDRIEKCQASQNFCIDTHKNYESNAKKDLPQYTECELTVYLNPYTMQPYEPNTSYFTKANGEVIYGNLRMIKAGDYYYKWTRSTAKDNESLGKQIVVTGNEFPGSYKLVANTYIRNRLDGKDSRVQIEIPVCTILPDNIIELSADGEATTFNMNLKVAENNLKEMIKIQVFDVEPVYYDEIKSASNKICSIPVEIQDSSCEVCDTPTIDFIKAADALDLNIILPEEEDYYCFAIDCLKPFNGQKSYLRFPVTNEEAKNTYTTYKSYQELLNSPIPEDPEEAALYREQLAGLKSTLEGQRDKLLIKVPLADTTIQIDGVPYLIAIDGGYEYYGDEEGINKDMTEIINGKTYRIAFITEQNLSKFSPIKFTFTGVSTE